MTEIIKSINKEVREKTAQRCKEKGIIIPTFKQLKNPETIPQEIKDKLKSIGLWDVNPLNLFRITWKNNIDTGLFGNVNYFEVPKEITGVKARIIGLIGKYFPTGAHKVGAAFGCLVPRLVSGEFDPYKNKAVWPSTGNYCRGGAFDCALLGCTAIAILPEEMSTERFEWLREIGAEVIATPGCESNVKEIYDKCWELKKDPINIIFNQFEEFGNSLFHYHITGSAIEEAFNLIKNDKSKIAAYISATGSAGTIAAGDYLKKIYPEIKITASEALQCPTLLMNGFGGHRIEGIGDKHVPWIHNSRNTDMITAIDDEDCIRIMRLFNEKEGIDFLKTQGLSDDTANGLSIIGISGIANLLSAIKTAKYYEFEENDFVFTVFTDSMDLYKSRIEEYKNERGVYNTLNAASDYSACLMKQSIDYTKELSYYDKKAIHNLKYYTWIEQQGRTVKELNALWNPEFWHNLYDTQVEKFDDLIEEFNSL